MNTRRTSRTPWLAVGALTITALAIVPTSAGANAESPAVRLRIISFNDFHGALDSDRSDDPETAYDEDRQNASVAEFATAIEIARAEAGEQNSLLLSAGDSIGSSPFVSWVHDDLPTIDVLNALDVQGSALGNHELDRGYDWLTGHVITGMVPPARRADFPILASNVLTLQGQPAFPSHMVQVVGGVETCVVGAVTAETEGIVPPPLGNIKVREPVEAINDVVMNLEAQGSCDITVALLHEGGALSGDNTLAGQYEVKPVFKRIVEGLDHRIDAIVTGHTHAQYAYVVPREGLAGRPVVQAGSSGRGVGVIDLVIDLETRSVVSAVAEVRDSTLIEDHAFPRVAAASKLASEAADSARAIGDGRVASVTAPVSRAWLDGGYAKGKHRRGTAVDVGRESTAGHVLADALYEAPVSTEFGPPDLGLLSEASVKNDWHDPGDLTFWDAFAIFPERFRVCHVALTALQLRKLLEQQWRADGGMIRLAVSSNVQVRSTPSGSLGAMLGPVLVDGKPIAPDENYVVATDNSLCRAIGGFSAAREGQMLFPDVTGAELFIRSYLRGRGAIAPDFGVRQVETDLPISVAAGQAVDGVVNGLDLTSSGSPRNHTLRTFISTTQGNELLASSGVENGKARVEGIARESGNVVAVAYPSGSVLGVPLSKWSTRLASRTEREFARDKSIRIQVKSDVPASGVMSYRVPGSARWRTADVSSGVAELRLSARHHRPGRYYVRAKYAGDGTHKSARGKVRLVVRKLKPAIKVVRRAKAGQPGWFAVVDTDNLVRPVGSLELRWGSNHATVPLRHGRALLPMNGRKMRGRESVRVVYSGSDLIARVKTTLRASDF